MFITVVLNMRRFVTATADVTSAAKEAPVSLQNVVRVRAVGDIVLLCDV